ncbi:hypothetical protein BV25DRAFT_1898430 [Artomyces pyxidatus]|uniref:Uncharacterized protein n=1 Tax=Artomyces pyxidatus TaxID=48021 RepID=A0ACB8T7T2_9AGAM|nr:hypothetical protein BV25DRAFT_1898430 [Artomyces pyxidatus]
MISRTSRSLAAFSRLQSHARSVAWRSMQQTSLATANGCYESSPHIPQNPFHSSSRASGLTRPAGADSQSEDPDSIVPPFYIERKRQRDAIEERKELEGGLMFELSTGVLSGDVAATTVAHPHKVPTEFAGVHPSGFTVPSPGMAPESSADRRARDPAQQTAAVAERVGEVAFAEVDTGMRGRREKVPYEVVEQDGAVRHPSGFVPPTPADGFRSRRPVAGGDTSH